LTEQAGGSGAGFSQEGQRDEQGSQGNRILYESREAAGRRNWPEAVPGKCVAEKGRLAEMSAQIRSLKSGDSQSQINDKSGLAVVTRRLGQSKSEYRPQKIVDAVLVDKLRSQGASWRTVSARLGVGLATVRRAQKGVPDLKKRI